MSKKKTKRISRPRRTWGAFKPIQKPHRKKGYDRNQEKREERREWE